MELTKVSNEMLKAGGAGGAGGGAAVALNTLRSQTGPSNYSTWNSFSIPSLRKTILVCSDSPNGGAYQTLDCNYVTLVTTLSTINPQIGLWVERRTTGYIFGSIGGAGSIVKSDSNAENWSTSGITIPANNQWTSAVDCPGFGKVVAIAFGGSGERVAYSDDATPNVFTQGVSADNTKVLLKIAYNPNQGADGRAVAVGTNFIQYTDDGINWVEASSYDNTKLYRCILYDGSRFVLFTDSGGSGLDIYTSADGDVWTLAYSTTGITDVRGVGYDPNTRTYAIACDNGNTRIFSCKTSNLDVWTGHPLPTNMNDLVWLDYDTYFNAWVLGSYDASVTLAFAAF